MHVPWCPLGSQGHVHSGYAALGARGPFLCCISSPAPPPSLGSFRQVPAFRSCLCVRLSVVSIPFCPQAFKDTCQALLWLNDNSQMISILRNSLQQAPCGNFKFPTPRSRSRILSERHSTPLVPSKLLQTSSSMKCCLLYSLEVKDPFGHLLVSLEQVLLGLRRKVHVTYYFHPRGFSQNVDSQKSSVCTQWISVSSKFIRSELSVLIPL